jgi:hypothetical protein
VPQQPLLRDERSSGGAAAGGRRRAAAPQRRPLQNGHDGIPQDVVEVAGALLLQAGRFCGFLGGQQG